MKKIFSILMLTISLMACSQNQTFTGVKTFNSPPVFKNVIQNDSNAKVLTINALGKLQYKNASTFVSPTPSLQQTTDVGNTTTNTIIANTVSVGVPAGKGNRPSVTFADATQTTILNKEGLSFQNGTNGTWIKLNEIGIYGTADTGNYTQTVFKTGKLQYKTNTYSAIIAAEKADAATADNLDYGYFLHIPTRQEAGSLNAGDFKDKFIPVSVNGVFANSTGNIKTYYVDNSTTGVDEFGNPINLTQTYLNTTYPTAQIGTMVEALNINTNPIYIKCSDGWRKISGYTGLVPN